MVAKGFGDGEMKPLDDSDERERRLTVKKFMGFKCGIVGLPNVGKSTLFNALTQTAAAQAANYPFCTIEPNVGEIAVPDPRLDTLAALAKSAADHADPDHLRRHRRPGARRLERRGARQPVSRQHPRGRRHRPCGALLRGRRRDPCRRQDRSDRRHRDHRDRADAGRSRQPRKARRRLEKKAKGGDKEARRKRSIWSTARSCCCATASRRGSIERKPEEEKAFHMLGLLTSLPVLYACNVDEAAAATGNEFSRKVEARAKEEGAVAVVISAKIESEIATLPPDERAEFLAAVGLKETGLDRLISAGYALLHLVTYFTVGPKEARAWTITRGTKAPQAAGVIHTDFERGFIRSETIAYDDYVACGGEAGARDAGKMRLEGKDYVVRTATSCISGSRTRIGISRSGTRLLIPDPDP